MGIRLPVLPPSSSCRCQVHRKATSCSRVAAKFTAGYFVKLALATLIIAMASADEMRIALKAYGPATAELVFLLSDNDVTLEHQYNLVKGGATTVGRLAVLEDDREEFRKTAAELAKINLREG